MYLCNEPDIEFVGYESHAAVTTKGNNFCDVTQYILSSPTFRKNILCPFQNSKIKAS
jgi:hypothetical protein